MTMVSKAKKKCGAVGRIIWMMAVSSSHQYGKTLNYPSGSPGGSGSLGSLGEEGGDRRRRGGGGEV